MFTLSCAGCSSKWPQNCEVMRICCKKPFPYSKSIEPTILLFYPLINQHFLMNGINTLFWFIVATVFLNRLQNILKKGAAKNCDPSTSNLSIWLQRCTISCSPFARSKCKFLFFLLGVILLLMLLSGQIITAFLPMFVWTQI